MKSIIETRRDFLKQAAVAVAFPFVFGCRPESSAQVSDGDVLRAIKKNAITDTRDEYWGARSAPDDVSWKTMLATDADKSERIVISGTIYMPDGKTPAPKTLIYLYHTDVNGIYGRGAEHRHGRYRGWMLTDSGGRYEFESILPASYPNSTISKHIHMTVTTRDQKEDYIDSILFEGDRFLTERERVVSRGGFQPVLTMAKKSDGKLHGVRDIRLG